MNDPVRLLESAEAVLLVDWPNPGVPRALVESGRAVFGYSPTGYSKAEIVDAPSPEANPASVFPPENSTQRGFLIFRKLPGRPPHVDIVAIYRPENELPGILADHVLPLKAKAVWLLRPTTSAQERAMVELHGILFIENCDIVAAVRASK